MERTQLGQLIAKGGEGQIFTTADPSLVAKIYHQGKMTAEVEQKLKAMLVNPPNDSMRLQGRVSIAWAVELVTVNGVVEGYVMPRLEKATDEDLKNPHLNLSKCRELIDFYHPKTRRKKFPWFHYLYLIRTARNIAFAVDALHTKGYTIGDVNESNILVALDTIVTFVDTDSFQVPDADKFYRCRVGKPEYTPPELQGVSFQDVDRTAVHDCFGLAVIIFQLLMQGQHPFAGLYQGQDEAPETKDRIEAGHFLHGKKVVPYLPVPVAPSFGILPVSIQELFIQCFETGYQNPSARPTAQQWGQALDRAEQEMQPCSVNPHHIFAGHLSQCPWCDLSQKFGGRDPFPSPAEIDLMKLLDVSLNSIQHKATISHSSSITNQQITSPSPILKPLNATHSKNVSSSIAPNSLPKSVPRKRWGIIRIVLTGTLGFGCILMVLVVNYIQPSPPVIRDRLGVISEYNAALKINPNDAKTYINRGIAKAALIDKQGAIDDYSAALKINPNDASTYFKRGMEKYNLADNQGAINDFNTTLKINPNHAESYYYLEMLKSEFGSKLTTSEHKAALNDIALKVNPNNAWTYNSRGIIKRMLEDKQGEVDDYNTALKIDPNYAEAYINRGMIKAGLGDKQRAIDDYTAALKINPNYAEAYIDRGIIKAGLGDNQGAINDYTAALKINPNNGWAYEMRGNVRSALGDKQGAIDDRNAALEIHPHEVILP